VSAERLCTFDRSASIVHPKTYHGPSFLNRPACKQIHVQRQPLTSPRTVQDKNKGSSYVRLEVTNSFAKMTWPLGSAEKNGGDKAGEQRSSSWTDKLKSKDWTLLDPRTLLSTAILTTSILVTIKTYRTYLKRIPEASYIRPAFFRKRSLFGTVTRVGDADNFHLFHQPGGRIAGWGWLPGRRVLPEKKDLKNRTIHIRLAGVDAPEGSHFGKPAQPYSSEALQWLRNYILNRRVRAYIYKKDQYDRIVATVWVRRYFIRRDVGKEMLKAGMATVYEAKQGAEFGDFEEKYRQLEETAKKRKRGIWGGNKKDFESPREYKTRTAKMGETK